MIVQFIKPHSTCKFGYHFLFQAGLFDVMKDYTGDMKYWSHEGSAQNRTHREPGHGKIGPKWNLSQWLEFLMTLIWIRSALRNILVLYMEPGSFDYCDINL